MAEKTLKSPSLKVGSTGLPEGQIPWESIIRKEGFYVGDVLRDTQPQTATNYTVFFTAYHPCEIIAAYAVWGTAATGGGSGALQLEKLSGTTAKGSGDTILATAWDLTSTANTPVLKIGTDFNSTAATVATDGLARTQFVPGERLALKSSGTITALKDLTVTVYLKGMNRGQYLT